MKIFATNKIYSTVIFCLSLSFVNTTLANDTYGRDYTLKSPKRVMQNLSRDKLRSISKFWDRHGIVRIAVISDRNFSYEFWSGIQLIDINTKEIYNIHAVECYISFCLYAGQVPLGKYFINKLYAYSYNTSNAFWRQGTTSAPIRNSMGSLEIKPWSITDLGLIGIYSDDESVKKGGFSLSFLGYHPDISAAYERLYREYRKHLNFNDKTYGWDDSEWKDITREKAAIEPVLFADFSRYHDFEDKLFFPTSLGMIFVLDLNEGFSLRKVDTLFMLNSLWINGNRWTTGGEYGRIYVSENSGKDWKTIDAFPADEVIIKVFEKDGKLHGLTASQNQKLVKLYADDDNDLQFSLISKVKFKLPGKSKGFIASMEAAEVSLNKLYFNREDLRLIRAELSDSHLVIQMNKERLAAYDFGKGKWKVVKTDKPIKNFSVNKNSVDIIAETHWMSKRQALRYTGEKFQEIPLEDKTKLRITTIYSYSADLRKKLGEENYFAVTNGGLYLREDGSRLAVLGLIEEKYPLLNEPPHRIYSIDADWSTTAIQSLKNTSIFFNSDLLPKNNDILLIDRVIPRVHKLNPDGDIDSHTIYDRALERLREIARRLEVQA